MTSPGCSVVGCLVGWGEDPPARIEVHHWAPGSVFGLEADRWPTSPLCRGHHVEWHWRLSGYDVHTPGDVTREQFRMERRKVRHLEDLVPRNHREAEAIRALLRVMRGRPAYKHEVTLPPAMELALQERIAAGQPAAAAEMLAVVATPPIRYD